MKDLHLLPKLRDSLTYLYVEHAILERDHSALLVMQETGRTLVPIAGICVLLLGPGTNITHAAIGLLVESGCTVIWVGEDAQLFYAQGMGETRRAFHLLRQAQLVSDTKLHEQVVMRMYEYRFGSSLSEGLTLEQVRGMEGARMRGAYALASRKSGVPWSGRRYDRSNWDRADSVNRALSAANAVLNGICHAAIVSGGYSPGLGFIHTGRQLSFVYDIADLYKVRITIPIAFETVANGSENVESRARQACREYFREDRLLEKILPDIDRLLGIMPHEDFGADEDDSQPESWWQPSNISMVSGEV
jgi:CRISPR-associated protein Cas1